MKKDKIKLFLHIGQPKTGTSAIQGFLNYNREYLIKKHSVLYPNFNNNDVSKGLQHNHAQFFINAKKNSDFNACLNTFKQTINYCYSNNISKIVISNEGFFWHWWPEFMKKIIEQLEVDFNVIVYLRRQDKYIESAWKQWGHKDPKMKNIQDYIKAQNLNWFNTLKLWHNFFSAEQIIVRPYEKNQIGDDIILDFLKILKIESKKGFTNPPHKAQNSNVGFNRDVIEILGICKSMTTDPHDNSLMNFMFDALPPKYLKAPMEDYNLLSPQEKIELINKYDASNNNIAKTFLGEERTKLFLDPIPDINENWKQYSGLTIEKLVPVFMEILQSQHREIQALKMSFNNLHNQYKNNIENTEKTEIDNTLIFNNGKFNNTESIRHTEKGIEFISTGNDPYLILPKLKTQSNIKTIIIDVTVPQPTVLQLFYKTKLLNDFNELHSIKRNILEGRNTISIKLPTNKPIVRLRLDPGNQPGSYIIHSIKFVS